MKRAIFNKMFINRACILLVFGFVLFAPLGYIFAQTPQAPATPTSVLDNAQDNLKGSSPLTDAPDLPLLIGRIFQVALGVLGVVLLCLIIYGGFTWMMASGNAEEKARAVKILLSASWGMIVILAAFTITSFVVSGLTEKLL